MAVIRDSAVLSMLQLMIKRLGTWAIFRPKSGKYEQFTKLVLGTVWITGHNLHQYLKRRWWYWDLKKVSCKTAERCLRPMLIIPKERVNPWQQCITFHCRPHAALQILMKARNLKNSLRMAWRPPTSPCSKTESVAEEAWGCLHRGIQMKVLVRVQSQGTDSSTL